MPNFPLKSILVAIGLIIFLFWNDAIRAQVVSIDTRNAEAEVLQILNEAEFENLRCISKDSILYVSFENREYRSDAEAVAVVIHSLLHSLKGHNKLSILYLELDLAIVQIDFTIPDAFDPENFNPDELFWQEHLSYTYNTAQALKLVRESEKVNKTLGKVDLEIEPRISFQLGDFRTPFKLEVNAYPALNVNLWKGGFFQASAYVPLYNYKYSNKYRYARSHIISLSQNFRIGNGKFLKIAAGTFTTNRLGVEAEWNSWHLNGMLKFGANVAYTGLFRLLKAGYEGLYGDFYDENVVEYAWPYYWTYNLSTEIRVPKTEVAVVYSYGRYLYDEFGHNIQIYRNFNEYLMGVQAYWGNGGTNFGFYVYLPLIPSKYYFNKKIRVKPTKYLNYSYLARSDYYWYYRTGYYPGLEYLEVNPQVIMNQLPTYLLLENRNENKQKNKN